VVAVSPSTPLTTWRGSEWSVPINTGWGVAQGDVVGFICNYGPTELNSFPGSAYQALMQATVSPICASLLLGLGEDQSGSPFDVIFGGYMINTGQTIYDICKAARSSGSWVNTNGWTSLPFIFWDINK
jgi:hypothetical protein